jgi:hypothetical protein
MTFKKALLVSIIALSAVAAENTQSEHFSWLGRETNGVPGLVINCKKQLPTSLQKVFDDSLERWQTHLHQNHGDFDIETLIKAVTFAAGLNDESELRHLLGSTMLLWDVGHVHNINLLVASLVRNSGASSDQIEWQFGPEVRRIVEEVRQFPAIKADSLSLSTQLIVLADRLHNFMQHKASQNRTSADEQRKLLHGLRGTSETLERLYESYLDEVCAQQ